MVWMPWELAFARFGFREGTVNLSLLILAILWCFWLWKWLKFDGFLMKTRWHFFFGNPRKPSSNIPKLHIMRFIKKPTASITISLIVVICLYYFLSHSNSLNEPKPLDIEKDESNTVDIPFMPKMANETIKWVWNWY